MKVGYKRVEDHEERGVHVMDAGSARGLFLHYHTEWDWVRVLDAPNITSASQMEEYLVNGEYCPVDIPDAEFNGLYEKAKSRGLPLFREMGDFDPSEFPSIRELIEESGADYLKRVLGTLIQAIKSERS